MSQIDTRLNKTKQSSIYNKCFNCTAVFVIKLDLLAQVTSNDLIVHEPFDTYSGYLEHSEF